MIDLTFRSYMMKLRYVYCLYRLLRLLCFNLGGNQLARHSESPSGMAFKAFIFTFSQQPDRAKDSPRHYSSNLTLSAIDYEKGLYERKVIFMYNRGRTEFSE